MRNLRPLALLAVDDTGEIKLVKITADPVYIDAGVPDNDIISDELPGVVIAPSPAEIKRQEEVKALDENLETVLARNRPK